jgi:hypothetical protein
MRHICIYTSDAMVWGGGGKQDFIVFKAQNFVIS